MLSKSSQRGQGGKIKERTILQRTLRLLERKKIEKKNKRKDMASPTKPSISCTGKEKGKKNRRSGRHRGERSRVAPREDGSGKTARMKKKKKTVAKRG